MANNPRSHDAYTVGWLCALPKEQTAATAVLDEIHPDLLKPSSDENTYTLGAIGKHNIVIACLPKHRVGTNQAAKVATRMLSTFPSIKIGLMVGIGGGIPPKVRLGDIVVSTDWVQWDFGKAHENGRFERTGRQTSPPTVLLSAMTKMESRHSMFGTGIPQYLKVVEDKYPALVPDYTSAADLTDPLDDNQTAVGNTPSTRKQKGPRVHYGLIASGNQVIKDAKTRDEINTNFGGSVLSVEMEAAGLSDLPYVIIRGICDYADSYKNDEWQEYAATVAAVYGRQLLEFIQPGEVNKEIALKESLDQVLDEIQVVKSKIDKQEDISILNWLTETEFESQHSDFLNRRQPGTGQWLLDSKEYQTWLKTPGEMLFCTGIPGAGKTILTSIVIHDLEVRAAEDSSIGIAYIYCNFNRSHEQQIDNLLLCLLKRFAQGQKSLPDCVKRLYSRIGAKKRPSQDEIFETLYSILNLYSQTYVVVDALDECQVADGCRARLIAELLKLKYYKTSVFVTSRPVPEVTNRFKYGQKLEIKAQDGDVRNYIKGQISRSGKDLLIKHCDLIEENILKCVNGMFLLAQLHFEAVKNKKSLKKIKAALKALPSGETAYDTAYKDAMARIEKNFDADSKFLAHQVLSWIVCARRPLTKTEMQHALAVEAGEEQLDKENLPETNDMVSVCAGLVTIDNESNVIRLVHYTAQEYFTRSWMNWFPNAHADITKTCLTYLSYKVFENGPLLNDAKFKKRLRGNPFYGYAATYWAFHNVKSLASPGHQDPNLQLLLSFIRKEKSVLSSIQASMVPKHPYAGYSTMFPTGMRPIDLIAHLGLHQAMEAIIAEGTLPFDTTNTYLETPLSYAAIAGHEKVAKLLLGAGANPDGPDQKGDTILWLAARNGHEDIVKILIENGANINIKDQNSQTPLWRLAQIGNDALMRLLLDNGCDIDTANAQQQTPLWIAVEYENTAAVKLLLERGAAIETPDKQAHTPLWRAVINNDKLILGHIGSKSPNLEIRDSSGRTPLIYAVEFELNETVSLLLDLGADPNAYDLTGRTASELICRRLANSTEPANDLHEQILQILLAHGADLDLLFEETTPLYRAVIDRNEKMIKILLANGANTEVRCKRLRSSGGLRTPLELAVDQGEECLGMVKLLLDYGAMMEVRDLCGRTLFLSALYHKREKLACLLLERGAEIDCEDEFGYSPLMYAAKAGFITIMEILLKKGAYIEHRSKDHETALIVAARYAHKKTVLFLLENGADSKVAGFKKYTTA